MIYGLYRPSKQTFIAGAHFEALYRSCRGSTQNVVLAVEGRRVPNSCISEHGSCSALSKGMAPQGPNHRIHGTYFEVQSIQTGHTWGYLEPQRYSEPKISLYLPGCLAGRLSCTRVPAACVRYCRGLNNYKYSGSMLLVEP